MKVLCRLLELGKILAQHRGTYDNNVTSGKHQQGSHSHIQWKMYSSDS